ncbi:MAG: tetratricopeptide repeat protein [Pseudomonadota bacterium]
MALATGAATTPAHASQADASTNSGADLERHSLFGSYLSGRLASRQREMNAAADFYNRALARDPDNIDIVKQALRAELSTANWERARILAPRVIEKEKSHRATRLFMGLTAFQDGRQTEARKHFAKAASGPIGELAAALASAWTHAADKDVEGAYGALGTLKKAKWAQYYRLYHRALISDMLGRSDEAARVYAELFKADNRTLRLTLAYARHAVSRGDYKRARQVLRTHLKAVNTVHPLARALLSDVRKGEAGERLVTKASEGMGEVFFSLGEALTSEGGVDIGAIYLQLAFYVRPDFPMAMITLGSVYEATRRYDRAIETYARIPTASPLFFNGEVRRAINLNLQERPDDAITALNGLVKRFVPSPDTAAAPERGLRYAQDRLAKLGLYKGEVDGLTGPATTRAIRQFQETQGLATDGILGDETLDAIEFATLSRDELFAKQRALRVLLTLGTVQRGHKKFEQAAETYSRAIALIDRPKQRHWRYFYSRGVSYERMKDWPRAEADLKRALELNPDEPLILNYLGYSWVDQNLFLDEALAMIRKAVKIKPDDGYFVDSLGWAYYRQGKYEEATKYLERAVELRPEDPTINDHLGDAYWHVGRLTEARFQWRQALSFEPEKKDAAIIRRKLERGLEKPTSRVADQKKPSDTKAE